MKTLFLILAFCLLPVAFSVEAATYYVNQKTGSGSTCSLASPCLTIQAGVNKTTTAGDIVDVAVGTYTETVSIWPTNGAAGNPIIVQAHPGDTVVWRGSGAAGCTTCGAAYIVDRNYIRITGFQFTSDPTANVIHVNHSAATNKTSSPTVGIEILNNTFTTNGNDGSGGGGMSEQINLEYVGREAAYSGATLNTISGNTFTNNWGSNITLFATSDVLIQNNTSTGNKGSMNPSNGNLFQANLVQMFIDGAQRISILNNTVSNMVQVSSQATEDIGIRGDSGSITALIQGNVIHDLGMDAGWNGNRHFFGIYLESRNNNHVVQQNVVYNINEACIGLGSGSTGTAQNNHIYNNTLYNCGEVGILLDNTSGTLVRNNIVAGTALSLVTVTPQTISNGGTVFSNNDWFRTGSTLFGLWNYNPNTSGYGTGTLNLANWSSSSGDANSKSVNPLFVSTSTPDFHLQAGSPAIDTGLNVGLAFSGTAPDMGAFETGTGTVTWTNDRGGSGTASGTANWKTDSPQIPLKAGINNITVTATDSGGNAGSATRLITYAPTFPGNTLAGAWGFNGNTNDSSINGNNATLFNGASYVSGTPNVLLNPALGNQYVEVPDNNSLDFTQSFTIGATVIPAHVLSGWKAVIVKNYMLYLYASTDPGSCPTGGPMVGVEVNGPSSPYTARYATCDPGGPLQINQPTHLEGTYNNANGQLILYRNGVAVATTTTPGGYMEPSTNTLTIGSSTFGEYFDGQISKPRVYNYALPVTAVNGGNTILGAACNFGNPLDITQQSITRDFNCPVISPTPPLPVKLPASATALQVGQGTTFQIAPQ